MNGAELIFKERKRQIEIEGWTPKHDDKHIYGELAQEIGHPCSTVPEDLQQIDAAIAVCKDDK
jgi:hypothetical protein